MCTGIGFLDKNNNLFMGRNLDVPKTYGEKVMITPRNYDYSYKHIENVKLKQAIIGMGIEVGGHPLYFDAANESGMMIVSLNFPKFAHYNSELKDDCINITPYEFMVWVLDNYKSVEDLKKDIPKINFMDTPFNEYLPIAPAHWIIGDNKEMIVVEPTVNGIKVYDASIGVVTNNPEYSWHLMNLNNYLGMNNVGKEKTNWSGQDLEPLGVGTGAFGMPGDYTPPSRLVKVAYGRANYPIKETETENVSKLFNLLKSVAMPEGSVDDEVTIYSSCYSTKTKTYYFDRCDDFQVHQLTMTEETMNATKLTILDK